MEEGAGERPSEMPGTGEAARAERGRAASTDGVSDLADLVQAFRERYEVAYRCSGCGREWWVPREVPRQGRLVVRGEPPGQAPAGVCPVCGRIYCVGCASEHVVDSRLTCAVCGEPLKLSDQRLVYLFRCIMDERAEVSGHG